MPCIVPTFALTSRTTQSSINNNCQVTRIKFNCSVRYCIRQNDVARKYEGYLKTMASHTVHTSCTQTGSLRKEFLSVFDLYFKLYFDKLILILTWLFLDVIVMFGSYFHTLKVLCFKRTLFKYNNWVRLQDCNSYVKKNVA